MPRCLDLSGTWEVRVPGAGDVPRRVRVPDEPPVPLGSQVPSVLYRYRFELADEEAALPGARLQLDGVLGAVRVRLNGTELGSRPAGMAPVALPAAGVLRPGLNELEIEVRAPGPDGVERALWGAYERPECVPPGSYPPGLTGPARLVLFDGLVITGCHWMVRPEEPFRPGGPPPAVAHVRCWVGYAAARHVTGRCRLRLRPEGFAAPGVEAVYDVEAAAGEGTWELWCSLPEPRPWTVWERGRPRLYRLEIEFEEAAAATRPARAPGGGTVHPAGGRCRWSGYVGIRTVEQKEGIFHLNGEPLFCRGACLLPPPVWPGTLGGRQAAGFVRRARALNLNALRVYAHRAHRAVYEAASRMGIVIWQDLPLTGPFQPRDADALRQQLPAWVDTVGTWPAVIAWSASQEPAAPAVRIGQAPEVRVRGRGAGTSWRQALPLPVARRAEREVARELAALDPGRPVVERAGAFSLWRSGGDARLFGGWRGRRLADPVRVLRLIPHAATLVSSFGAPAAPVTRGGARGGGAREDRAAHRATGPGSARPATGDRAAANADTAAPGPVHAAANPGTAGTGTAHPATGPGSGMESWTAAATHSQQAENVRYTMEALRRRKAQPAGGGFVFALNDAWPGPGYGLYDAEGRPRPAARAYRDACRPVRLLADRPPRPLRRSARLRLAVWLVNDTAEPVRGRWTWELRAGERVLAAQTAPCAAEPNGLAPAGWVEARVPADPGARLVLRLVLDVPAGESAVEYPLPAAGEEPPHEVAKETAGPELGPERPAGEQRAGESPPGDAPRAGGEPGVTFPEAVREPARGAAGNRIGVRFVLKTEGQAVGPPLGSPLENSR